MKEKILYKRALITCCFMLFTCIIFKLFGVRWFDLNTNVPMLMKIDNVVMSSMILSFIYSWLFMFINYYLMICIAVKKHNGKKLIISTLIISLLAMLTKFFLKNYAMSLLFTVDILYLMLDYKLNCNKFNFVEFILVMILNILYQGLSLFIRGLGYHASYYGLLASVLLNLDYYIMLVMTYLYLKKGDENLCSIFHQLFSSLQKVHLKKHTKDYLNKEN